MQRMALFVSWTCLAALPLLAAVGCRTRVYTVSTTGPQESSLFHEYRVMQNGKVLTTLEPNRIAEFKVRGDSRIAPAQTLQSLSVEAFTPCGWRAQSCSFSPHLEQDPAYYLNVADPAKDWQQVSVLVDNRSGPAARVGIGALQQNVDAGHYADLDFAFSQVCPEADQLMLNGQVIASVSKLEKPRRDKSEIAHILVDTTASHCYTFESAQYGAWNPEEPVQRVKKLSAARAQILEGNLNYYFTALPEQIKVSNLLIMTTEGAINDRSCTM